MDTPTPASDLPTLTTRQALKALMKHRIKDERMKKGGREVSGWVFEIDCTCGQKCGEGLREDAYKNYAKHAITAGLKEDNG